jgi:DNA-binding NtrC family response regulator
MMTSLIARGICGRMASNSDEAINLLDAPGANFSALITDVNLPGKFTGWDVAKHARELSETLPVVYMTGGRALDWASKGVPNSMLVTKPFAAAQIVTAVSQLLNVASGSTP